MFKLTSTITDGLIKQLEGDVGVGAVITYRQDFRIVGHSVKSVATDVLTRLDKDLDYKESSYHGRFYL